MNFNPDKSNEKLTECGKPLSQELFIGNDGTLSVHLSGDECEVTGFIETQLGLAFNCKPK